MKRGASLGGAMVAIVLAAAAGFAASAVAADEPMVDAVPAATVPEDQAEADSFACPFGGGDIDAIRTHMDALHGAGSFDAMWLYMSAAHEPGSVDAMHVSAGGMTGSWRGH